MFPCLALVPFAREFAGTLVGAKLEEQMLFGDTSTVRVEMKDGSVEVVDLRGSVPGHPMFGDYKARNKSLWYNSKSGLHKEVRLRNYGRALAYARILDSLKKGSARQYLRSIWGEEMSSLQVLRSLYAGLPTYRLVRGFCATAKDWELRDRSLFSPYWMGVAASYGWRYEDTEAKIDPPQYKYPKDVSSFIAEKAAAFAGGEDSAMEDLYELVVMSTCWTPTAERIKKNVRLSMVHAVQSHSVLSKENLGIVGRLASAGHDEEVLVLWRLLSRTYTDKDDEVLPVKDGCQIDVPYPEPYVFDVHTWKGKVRLGEVGHEIDWEKPMPLGVDLRYSGDIGGTLWRYLAFEQHGTIEVPWESVFVPKRVLLSYGSCSKVVR